MNSRGHTHLLTFFKGLTEGAFYLVICLFILSLAIFILSISGEETLLSAWPAEFTHKPETHNLVADKPAVANATLLTSHAELVFSSNTPGYYVLKLADIIIPFTVAFFVILSLRKLFRNLLRTQPFTIDNIRQIRQVAYLLLMLVPLGLLRTIMYHRYIRAHIQVEDLDYAPLDQWLTKTAPALWLEYELNTDALLAGLLLLVLAQIFRSGVVIKEENEAFV